MPVTNPTLFNTLIGDTITRDEIYALGGSAATYVTNFENWMAVQHWNTTTYNGAPLSTPSADTWISVNYYDRAFIYYAWYKMTGNETYLTRANQIAVYYRDTYIIANDWGPALYNAMVKGMAVHYAATGDEDSRIAVARVAELFWTGAPPQPSNPDAYQASLGTQKMDGRTRARVLESQMLAHLIGATSENYGGRLPSTVNFLTNAQSALTLILSEQALSGSDNLWRYAYEGYIAKPFMIGLLMDAFILYYKTIDADSRIPPVIQSTCEALFSAETPVKCWIPATKDFYYLQTSSIPDAEGQGPNQDLHGLLINGFAFTYHQTGNELWRTRANDILTGSLGAFITAPTALSSQKTINQQYTTSYKAFYYLQDVLPQTVNVTWV